MAVDQAVNGAEASPGSPYPFFCEALSFQFEFPPPRESAEHVVALAQDRSKEGAKVTSNRQVTFHQHVMEITREYSLKVLSLILTQKVTLRGAKRREDIDGWTTLPLVVLRARSCRTPSNRCMKGAQSE
jgi:hypothetical protein